MVEFIMYGIIAITYLGSVVLAYLLGRSERGMNAAQ